MRKKEIQTATGLMLQNQITEQEAHLRWFHKTFSPFVYKVNGGSEVRVDKLIKWIAENYIEGDKYRRYHQHPEVREEIGNRLKELVELFERCEVIFKR